MMTENRRHILNDDTNVNFGKCPLQQKPEVIEFTLNLFESTFKFPNDE